MKMEAFRKKLKSASGTLDDRVDAQDVVDHATGDSTSLDRKVEQTNMVIKAAAKIEKCKTANDVLSGFAKDAAAGKVVEMITARSSQDRQRAQDTVLNYALGKPVDRVMSINMEVSNMSEKEIDHKIEELLEGFGKVGKGTATSLIIESEGGEGCVPPEELPASPPAEREAVVSAEVSREPSVDKVSDCGKPRRKNARGSGGTRHVRTRRTPVQKDKDA